MKRILLYFCVAVIVLSLQAPLFAKSAYSLRYEAVRYGTALSIIQHRVINEQFANDSLKVNLLEYRLDRKTSEGMDSLSLGKGLLATSLLSDDSLAAARTKLLSMPAAKVLAGHTIQYLGEVDTIAGLISYKYVVVTEGVYQFFVWLAEAPPGLEKLVSYESIEYSQRMASYLIEEELRNMIRLVIFGGIQFPPNQPGTQKSFIITRYDTAVKGDYFTAKDNTYLFELKALSVQ